MSQFLPRIALTSAVLTFAVPTALGRADAPGWASGFGMDGADEEVRATIVFDDGSGPALYAAGDFFALGNALARGIARWDGVDWSPLGEGLGFPGSTFSTSVSSLAVYDDGTGPALYAGGAFTEAGGTPVNRIAKWDGSAWSPVGSGVNDVVRALAVFDGGSGPVLVAGGRFTTAGGAPANRLARWDGQTWAELGGGIDVHPSAEVRVLRVFDLGSGPRLGVGGNFLGAGGVLAPGIVAWDGTSWSPFGPLTSSQVYALEVFDDGNGPALFAGGTFGEMGGVPDTVRIARWDGSSWSSIGRMTDPVHGLLTHDDGTGQALYAAGDFNFAGGVDVRGIARWDGTSWSPLDQGLIGFYSSCLASFDDGTGTQLYVGGLFQPDGGPTTSNIARWNGAAWSSIGTGNGADDRVRSFAVFDDGGGADLYVGGDFTETGPLASGSIRRWDGAAWSLVGSFGLGQALLEMLVHDDGGGPDLYVGGSFGSLFGVPGSARLARWDGTAWSALGVGTGITTGFVSALASLGPGEPGGPILYVGGTLSVANGVALNNVAAWNGTAWAPLGAGLDGPVEALTFFDDGNGLALYAGGWFTSSGGVSGVDRVARWDGATWGPVGSGTNDPVGALVVYDDGSGPALYAGGIFTSAGGAPAKGVAKWDGATWSPLGSGVAGFLEDVYALEVHDDGGGPQLYVGGAFNTAGGVPAKGIARWNGSQWTAPDGGVRGDVLGLRSWDDDGVPRLFVGGDFDRAGSTVSLNIAEWRSAEGPVTYCQGELSSLGCVSSIDTTGVPSATGTNPFALVARDMIPGEAGFVLYGFQKANLAFHGGRLCVKAPIQRWLPPKAAKSTGSPPCTGVLSRDFNARIQSGADAQLTAGQTVFAQWLQRDPADPGGNLENLTNAVRFVICP